MTKVLSNNTLAFEAGKKTISGSLFITDERSSELSDAMQKAIDELASRQDGGERFRASTILEGYLELAETVEEIAYLSYQAGRMVSRYSVQ